MDVSFRSTRRALGLSLVGGLLLSSVRTAMACYKMPAKLARPHAVVVAEAKQIFWAEVSGSQLLKQGSEGRKTVRYRLKVLRVLKGQVGSTFELEGEGDLSGISDTTFADHTEDSFWKHASGRMGIEPSCAMSLPVFITGKRYLVMLSPVPDTKQFERVDSEQDRWFKFVESKTTRAQ